MRPILKKNLTRGATTVLTVVALFIGFIGYLHTPAGKQLPIGRKILGWIGVPCPLGQNLSPQAVEASRLRGVAAYRGTEVTSKRPALGLVLNSTTETEAKNWAASQNLNCHSLVRGTRFLDCSEIKKPGTTTLAFNPSGKLVAVDVFLRKVSEKNAEPLLSGISKYLSDELGAPQIKTGEFTRDYLLATPRVMKTSFIQYRFKNYVAAVTASYLPWSGLMVHEQYSSAE